MYYKLPTLAISTSPRPSWLLGKENFVEQEAQFSISLPHLSNLGIYEQKITSVRTAYRRNDLAPLCELKFTERVSGAAFYELGGSTVVIKPEVCVLSSIGQKDRIGDAVRNVLPLIFAVSERGIRTEEPLGWLTTQEGRSNYIVTKLPGVSLREVLDRGVEPASDIYYAFGKALGEFHKKGVLHGHPHDGNILISNGAVILIDLKACTFSSDYPHTFRSGRIITWEKALASELAGAESFCEQRSAVTLEAFRAGYRTMRL